MVQVHSLIGSVVSAALFRASAGAGPGDLVLGLVAAMRRLRGIIHSQAGHSAVCGLDDSIREMVLLKALDSRGGRSCPVTVALPRRTPATRRAELILEDAALSAVVLNGWFPGNTAIQVAVEVVMVKLMELLGGAPEWSALADLLHSGAESGSEDEDEDEVTAPALH